MKTTELDVQGKVIVLSGVQSFPMEAVQALAQRLSSAGAQLVLVMPEGDVSSLDDDEMEQAGWTSVQRGGGLEAWLRQHRERCTRDSIEWLTLDRMLDELRERADYGLGLRAALPRL